MNRTVREASTIVSRAPDPSKPAISAIAAASRAASPMDPTSQDPRRAAVQHDPVVDTLGDEESLPAFLTHTQPPACRSSKARSGSAGLIDGFEMPQVGVRGGGVVLAP